MSDGARDSLIAGTIAGALPRAVTPTLSPAARLRTGASSGDPAR